MVIFYVALSVWYYGISISPRSFSEYMPGESPASPSTIGLYAIFAVIWIGVLALSLRMERLGLMAAAAWAVFGIVGALAYFATGQFTAPDFSDLLFFPISIVGIVVCLAAWRSTR